MKSCDGGLAGSPENRLTARSNRAPPGVELRGAPAVRRAILGEDESGPRGGHEVVGDLAGVVVGVLVVLVERHRPRHFLGGGVDLDRTRRPRGPPRARPASPRLPDDAASAEPAGRGRPCSPRPPRASAGQARRPGRPSRRAPAAAPSRSHGRSSGARRERAPARAVRAPQQACPAPGNGHAACRTWRSTAGRRYLATPPTWLEATRQHVSPLIDSSRRPACRTQRQAQQKPLAPSPTARGSPCSASASGRCPTALRPRTPCAGRSRPATGTSTRPRRMATRPASAARCATAASRASRCS